ncbi:hypothetical protein HNQ93_002207 [Hymenobacter luteus]|uniref:DUF2851 family protein n=2 Tax=Hymenobacter TaxID=89966 RepID=A0A7W9WD63_9BACT|nr:MULTISPECIES: DUF2851 family protein [Hymenobacter]MBB4602224.1 hypothetical protein [Hymenobacter latericoloratus]MBB6059347.1 hypothetical protein [Hymenobacter luteus]
MQEDFLHYVWQHQYFDKTSLQTEDGQPITVLRPGQRNPDAGPDFLNARLQLGEVEWNGAVEIHIRASDWHRHQHQTDLKYDQVVLHVVYTADQEVARTDNSVVPALALSSRIAPPLLATYERLREQPPEAALPCAPLLTRVSELTRTMMTGRTLMERVEQKADLITALHQQQGQDWEATSWHALAAAFGFQKNTEPMARLAKALPLSVVRRHRHDARQLAALVFGQAGFLEDAGPTDAYLQDLRQEFGFLRHKYNLSGTALAPHDWNFLRLRPANFPTVRLAQLTGLLHARPTLFDVLLSARDIRALEQFFATPLPEYWQTHYRPGKAGKVAVLGRSSIHLLVTNLVVPLRVAYAHYVGNPEQVEAAVALLDQLPAEQNHVLDVYELAGFRNATAADSQGLLALHRRYCEPRQCVRCAIGGSILRQR